jgi:hypothetical protein
MLKNNYSGKKDIPPPTCPSVELVGYYVMLHQDHCVVQLLAGEEDPSE